MNIELKLKFVWRLLMWPFLIFFSLVFFVGLYFLSEVFYVTPVHTVPNPSSPAYAAFAVEGRSVDIESNYLDYDNGIYIFAGSPKPFKYWPFLSHLTKSPKTKFLTGELIGAFPDYKKRELYWRDDHTLVFEYCKAEIKSFKNKIHLEEGGGRQTYEVILLRNCDGQQES